MEKTARGYHEGGDADWEEKKLKNYAHSEVRLAEIQSMLCTDIVTGKSQVSDQLEHVIVWIRKIMLFLVFTSQTLEICAPAS